MVTIRPATAADREHLGRFGGVLMRQHHADDPRRFIQVEHPEAGYGRFLVSQLANPNSLMMVAEHSGAVVGHVYADVEATNWMELRGPCGVVHDVYVDEAARLPPRTWTLLALLGNQPVPSPPPVLIGDTRPSSRITVAYMLAAAGDTVGARRALEQLRAMPRTTKGLHGATPEFLEAWIAYRAGRWDDVVRLISRPARTESDFGNGSDIDRIGPSHEQWLVGQAYERLGRPDSAAAYYELMLGPAPLFGCRFAGPHIHQRLALLYAGMGRMPDAERHVAALESMWTRPDGTGQRMLDEARRAVKAARGMARPETGHT